MRTPRILASSSFVFAQVLRNGNISGHGHDGKMAFVIALAAKQSWLEKRPVKVAG